MVQENRGIPPSHQQQDLGLYEVTRVSRTTLNPQHALIFSRPNQHVAIRHWTYKMKIMLS